VTKGIVISSGSSPGEFDDEPLILTNFAGVDCAAGLAVGAEMLLPLEKTATVVAAAAAAA